MQKISIAVIVALLGLVANAAAQPTFPVDSVKTAFAKGVLLSQTPMCTPFGMPNTNADVTLYSDLNTGRVRTVMGCGDNEMNSFTLCTPKPVSAAVMCTGGNCTCMVSPFPPQCPPPSYNASSFNYIGVKNWYGDIKADKWEVVLPGGVNLPNGTAVYIYTNGPIIAGFEVFTSASENPFVTMIFKKWSVVVPDDADFELPADCKVNMANKLGAKTMKPKMQRNARGVFSAINAFLPFFNF